MLKKLINLTFLIVCLAIIIFLQHNPFLQSEISNPEQALTNQKPIVLAPPESIDSTPFIINHGPRNSKKIALTFDADMTPQMENELLTGRVTSWYNAKLIDELRQTRTKATLFLTGLWVTQYPTIAKQLAADPLFEIGNHSWDHPDFGGNCYGLPLIPLNQDKPEIEKTQQEIQKITGVMPKDFRFPGGCYNQQNLAIVKHLGLQVVNWDVIGGDSYLKNAKDIEKTILSQVQDGSIIILHMHDPGQHIAGDTADAIVPIIIALNQKGYQFVTISELLNSNQNTLSYFQKNTNNLADFRMPLSPSTTPYLTRNLQTDL